MLINKSKVNYFLKYCFYSLGFFKKIEKLFIRLNIVNML